jgi:hypothetical protein
VVLCANSVGGAPVIVDDAGQGMRSAGPALGGARRKVSEKKADNKTREINKIGELSKKLIYNL